MKLNLNRQEDGDVSIFDTKTVLICLLKRHVFLLRASGMAEQNKKI